MVRERNRQRHVRVAMVKTAFEEANREANFRKLERLSRPVAGRNLDVMITPECFLDGYMVKNKKWTRDDLKRNSEPGERGDYVQRLKQLARDLECYIVAGLSECVEESEVRNAAYLFGRNGEVVGKYYKIHVHQFYTRGNSLPVFDCDFGRVGVVICADRRWPENIRVLRLKGAEVILIPTWGMHHRDNQIWMQTRAYENGLFVCFTHPMQSFVTGPTGKIEAILESNVEDVLIHDIDLNQIVPLRTRTKDVSKTHPIQNRYPELYRPLAEKQIRDQ